MAWSTPLTAVANSALTAAQWNATVRDNLLETAPAKATAAGRIMVTTGTNAIAERVIAQHTINTAQTTASSSYVDLATVGPQVTLVTGARALVWWNAQMSNSLGSSATRCAIEVSGATSISPSDSHDLYNDGLTAGNATRFACAEMFDTLTPGTNTFTVKYKVNSGTGTYTDRHLIVMAL